MIVATPTIQLYVPATALTFISRGCVVSIPFSEIILVRKHNDRTYILTEREEYVGTGPLVHFEKMLPVNDFIRVHKSIILATAQLQRLHTEIPVTPHYRKLLKVKFKAMLEQGYRTIAYAK